MNIVVTGSTRGLGFALADALLTAGATVVVRGRTGVDEALRKLAHHGDRVKGCAADVARYDDCERLFAALPRVDMWINNAGTGGPPVPFAESAPKDVGPVVAANLAGTMNGCRVAAAGMKAHGGTILNTEGFGANGLKRTGMAVYGATKYAVRYFTQSLVKELAGTPVRVATIVPGLIITDMLVLQYKHADARQRSFYEKLALPPEETAALLAPRLLAGPAHGDTISLLGGARIVSALLFGKPTARPHFERALRVDASPS